MSEVPPNDKSKKTDTPNLSEEHGVVDFSIRSKISGQLGGGKRHALRAKLLEQDILSGKIKDDEEELLSDL